ncbi:zinc finger BED domain-containing protein 4-like isoform X2 [Macrobrachium rosenbergii]|uniref:zinc finger BED domain-containing protein 4-like isoform X2 n=1 Tax=Macrobrachium rosenbergii TaxID=79674 RepID=UPI0034D6046D
MLQPESQVDLQFPRNTSNSPIMTALENIGETSGQGGNKSRLSLRQARKRTLNSDISPAPEPRTSHRFRTSSTGESDDRNKTPPTLRKMSLGRNTTTSSGRRTAGGSSQSSGITGGVADGATIGGRVTGVCPIANLGNTCFLNSVLYALRFLPGFTHDLHHLHMHLQAAGNQSDGTLDQRIQFLSELHSVFVSLGKEERNVSDNKRIPAFHPYDFLEALRVVNPMFEGNRQQDAHELLHCLLDQLCHLPQDLREGRPNGATNSDPTPVTQESDSSPEPKRLRRRSERIQAIEEDSSKKQAWTLLAKAIFSSCSPLRLVENKHWQNFFAVLRPSFKIPSRDQLSNTLLENIYQECLSNAKEAVASSQSVAVLLDGWTNIRNEGIINIMVTVPTPIFWKSISAGAESHTGEYFSQIIKSVVEEVGPMKVWGVCTDNAANMKKAWVVIREEFPHIQTYGCLAHTLHLMFTDIMKAKSIESVQKECTNLVKHIKSSQKLLAIFRKLQSEGNEAKTSLKLPVKTRWGSIIHCMQSIQENKHTLQKLAIDEEAKKGLEKSAKGTLLSEVFWDKIAGYLQLLKPVATAITMTEGDDQYLSIVMKVFHDLQSSFDEQLPNSPVLQSEESFPKEVVSKRREWLVQKVHLAANLLDPRYRGCHISDEEAVDAIELAYEVALRMPSIDEKKVLGEIAEFRAKEKLFSKPFIWQSVDQCSPTSWWNGMCSHTQLSKVATGILNLPPTSALVERSFSRHSHIHSSDRNCLSTDRAAKLVYVAHHLTLDEKLHRTSTPQPSTLADAPLSQKEKPSSSRCSSASSLKDKSSLQNYSSEDSEEDVGSEAGHSSGNDTDSD